MKRYLGKSLYSSGMQTPVCMSAVSWEQQKPGKGISSGSEIKSQTSNIVGRLNQPLGDAVYASQSSTSDGMSELCWQFKTNREGTSLDTSTPTS